MENSTGHTYWKRPWHKWLILATAILQLLCLWMNLREYRSISAAGILSDPAWTDYAAQKRLQCALNGMMAACFSGHFLIGVLARSPKTARLAEGLLLLLLALAWAAACLVLQLFSRNGKGALAALILVSALAGAVCCLLQYRKNR